MPKAFLGGMELEMDDDGFLQEPEKWNRGVADDLAKKELCYPMNDDQWKCVDYIRNYYLEYDIAPAIKRLCKRLGMEREYADKKLFIHGLADGACKIAGLPKPTGCV